jgi:hypothetical protein
MNLHEMTLCGRLHYHWCFGSGVSCCPWTGIDSRGAEMKTSHELILFWRVIAEVSFSLSHTLSHFNGPHFYRYHVLQLLCTKSAETNYITRVAGEVGGVCVCVCVCVCMLHYKNSIFGPTNVSSSPVVLSHDKMLFWWVTDESGAHSVSLFWVCLILMVFSSRYHMATLLEVAFSWDQQTMCDNSTSVRKYKPQQEDW